MGETKKSHRSDTQIGTVRSKFALELGRANVSMVAGFALCQLWLSLCFFAPQLFPENSSVSVYEISLVVCVLCLIPGIITAKRYESLLERRSAIYTLAACAGVGTFIIPFSSGAAAIDVGLQIVAGILTGIASGWLFVAWYQAFCRANDLAGFILSVVSSSLFMYVLTVLAFLPDISPWIMVFIACIMPFVSAFFLKRSPKNIEFVTEATLPKPGTTQKRALLLLCLGIFVVSFVDEFMRNYYLEGTDLLFYSGNLNLVLLIAKIVCSVLLVAVLAEHSHHMSLIYRASFLLAMIAVLFMPYTQNNPSMVYSITNFGAFLFKLMIMIISFNYCQRYRTSPILVFSLTRMTFSLDLLLGFGLFHVYKLFAPSVPDLLGITSVILGLLIVATYLFVFTNKSAVPVFEKVDPPDHPTDNLQSICNRLVRIGGLSKRESEVLALIAKGRSTPRIQDELSLSMN
ncbi:MAG: hypothetical protein RR619_00370, partial [Raoultibacter sp.]